MTVRRALVAALAIGAAGCAPRAFVRPAGPSSVEPDAAAIWHAASASCRETAAVQAALGLTGRIRGRRIPGLAAATIYTVATATGDIALEARMPGRLLFKLGGNASLATLLLVDDRRVVRGPAAEIVDALMGVRLEPGQLLAVLAGCISRADRVERGLRYDRVLEVTTTDATVFLEPRGTGWTPRAGTIGPLAIEYDRDASGALREIRFRSAPGAAVDVALSLRVKAIDAHPALTAGMLAVSVPDDARPMTLDELRDAGPAGNGAAP
jgi:hypothetical protein